MNNLSWNRICFLFLFILLAGVTPGFTQETGSPEFIIKELQAQTDFTTFESWKLTDDGSIFIASEASNRIALLDGNRKRLFSFRFPYRSPIGNFMVSDDGSVFGALSERDASKPRFCQPFFADKDGLVLRSRKLRAEFCLIDIFDAGALVTTYSGDTPSRKTYYVFFRNGELRRILKTPSKYDSLSVFVRGTHLAATAFVGDCDEEGACVGDSYTVDTSYQLKRAKYLDGYSVIASAGKLSIVSDESGSYFYSTGRGKQFSLEQVSELGNSRNETGIHPQGLNARGTVLAVQLIQDSLDNVPFLYDRKKGLRALFDVAPFPGHFTGVINNFQINRRGQILVEVVEGIDYINSKVYLLSPAEK